MRLGGRLIGALLLTALFGLGAFGARAQDEPASPPAAPAPAHPAAKGRPNPVSAARNVSFSQWTVQGQTVRLRVMLPTDAARALGDAGKPVLSKAAEANAVHDQFTVTTGASECPAIDQGEGIGEIYTLARSPGLDRFEMIFVCSAPGPVILHDRLLFSRAPGHVNYASVQTGTGRAALQLFTAGRQAIALPASAQGAAAGVFAFVRLGALRMLTGADHLLMLAGLLLLALRWRDLAMIAAGLAAGYLACLALGLNGSLTLDPALGATALGLMVAALGSAGLRLKASQPPAGSGAGARRVVIILLIMAALAATAAAFLHNPRTGLAAGGLAILGLVLIWAATPNLRPAWLMAVPAAIFALIDGMGPAADLVQLKPAPAGLAQALLGEGLGAGGAGLAAIALVMGLLWLMRRRLGGLRGAASELAGAILVGAGVFWFVSRLYS